MAGPNLQQPNILFILTDDQGYWAMGCAGNPEIRTPNLDRLAATGIRFENFFCASPVCSPARASILTGRIPSQHGIHDFLRAGNAAHLEGDGRQIEYLAGVRAYTDLLAGQGYTCALSGKWHMGDSIKPQKSFTFWDVHATGAGAYYQAPMLRNGQPYQCEAYVSDLITDNALRFLESQLQATNPFCLHVHYTAPHAPWEPEDHPQALYDDYYHNCVFTSLPNEPMHPQQLYKPGLQMGRTDDERRAVLSGYFAAVTAMDANVGRLLNWLETHKLREHTLVIFTSDNGMSMGHHGIYGKGNGTFPPNMFDTAVKVPALISRPGHVPQGQVSEALLSHYDLMPTLLDYVGVDNPEADSLPGQSFAALLQGQELPERPPVMVYDEYGPTRMIRTSEWKYIHRYPFGPNELYHLATDPAEAHNLIDLPEHQSKQQQLWASLENWFARYVDPNKDGTHEAVMGRGQINIVGPAAQGQQRFADDLVYLSDMEA